MFITPAYVAAISGANVADEARVAALISAACNLVAQDARQQQWVTMPSLAPEAARVAAAQLVAWALDTATPGAGGATVRAEQIGDYRVEFQSNGGGTLFGMDVSRVRHLYAAWRPTAYQTVTSSPWDEEAAL